MGRRKVEESTRRAIVHELLKRSIDGDLPHGAKVSVADMFTVHRSTVWSIWGLYTASIAAGNIGGDISCKYKGNSGRKGYNKTKLKTKVQAVPAEQRSIIRATASGVGVSVGVIQRFLDSHEMAAKTTTMKPILKRANMARRVQYALSFLDDTPALHEDAVGHAFDPMLSIVDVDEKWFNHDKKTRRYYLVAGEDPPERYRRSARHIDKTMFLAAVARPRWDPHRKSEFDGKFGLWPFAEEYVAQRRSKYRSAGTVLQRNMDTVNSEVYKHFLLEFVFAAIRSKLPRGDRGKIIYVQQDNATPHVRPNDADVVREGKHDGWDIRLIFQPPNSPDFNVLGLGYFSAIQTLQYETYIATTKQLIEVVQESSKLLDKTKLDNIFLTLQQVMECVLACKGGNEYKLPPMGKAKLRRKGQLPKYRVCDPSLYEEASSLALNF